MTDTFHQQQVKKDNDIATIQIRFRVGYAKAVAIIEAREQWLTEYGQELREDMREYAELMGYEYVDGHMDDLGIPPREADSGTAPAMEIVTKGTRDKPVT